MWTAPFALSPGKRRVVDSTKVAACVRRVTWWNKSKRHPEAKAVRFTSNSMSLSDSTTSESKQPHPSLWDQMHQKIDLFFHWVQLLGRAI